MTTQPEALRLAAAICDYSRYGSESEQVAKLRRMKADTEAAAELRRLHEVNQELLESLKAYQKAGFGQSTDHHLQGDAYDLAIKAIARAAIAKGETK
jgi:hypothetical protein